MVAVLFLLLIAGSGQTFGGTIDPGLDSMLLYLGPFDTVQVIAPTASQLNWGSVPPGASYDQKIACLKHFADSAQHDLLVYLSHLVGTRINECFWLTSDVFLTTFARNVRPIAARRDVGEVFANFSIPSDPDTYNFTIGVRPSQSAGSAVFCYELPLSCAVSLRVVDPSGRVVRTLISVSSGHESPGPHEAAWDGRDGRGVLMHAGVCFCVLQAGSKRVTAKLVLLRR
jgi:hypothetical protein